jgi:hypothetical protein
MIVGMVAVSRNLQRSPGRPSDTVSEAAEMILETGPAAEVAIVCCGDAQEVDTFQAIVHLVRQHYARPGVTVTESRFLNDPGPGYLPTRDLGTFRLRSASKHVGQRQELSVRDCPTPVRP